MQKLPPNFYKSNPVFKIGFLTDTNNRNGERDKVEPRADGGMEKERDFRESSRDREKSTSLQRVRIVNYLLVYDGLNLGRRIDLIWPDESMRFRGGRSYWKNWVPLDLMEGVVRSKFKKNFFNFSLTLNLK